MLALVAPRPCLVYNPRRDREADSNEVARSVDRARKAWPPDAAGALTCETPDDINRFQADQQRALIHWYEQLRAKAQGDGH